MNSFVQLNPSVVKHIPLKKYDEKFTFIVNDEKFQTTRIIADLLSPKISQNHFIDPTSIEYSITTQSEGNFSNILNLFNFEINSIPDSELSFFIEIMEKLDQPSANIDITKPTINRENSISFLLQHQQYPNFYSLELDEEVKLISSNFYDLSEDEKSDLKSADLYILEKILSSGHLCINNEDELIEFINPLYGNDSLYGQLYQYVNFGNLASESIKDFLRIFNVNDINGEIWSAVSRCLSKETLFETKNRYIHLIIPKSFLYEGKDFNGVIRFFKNKNNIDDNICILYSSKGGGEAKSIFDQEDSENESCFWTGVMPNSWIEFEFKKYRIEPSNYTIRTYNNRIGSAHMKNWVLEGSNNKVDWCKLDEQSDSNVLNGPKLVHTFAIDNDGNKSFRFLRIRQTGLNWSNKYILGLNAIEFYGNLYPIDQ